MYSKKQISFPIVASQEFFASYNVLVVIPGSCQRHAIFWRRCFNVLSFIGSAKPMSTLPVKALRVPSCYAISISIAADLTANASLQSLPPRVMVTSVPCQPRQESQSGHELSFTAWLTLKLWRTGLRLWGCLRRFESMVKM